MYFHLRPEKAILADINRELIDTYRAIKGKWRQVVRELRAHELQHSDSYYYYVREMRPRALVGRAARFLYLNRTCWNGLYRVNLNGEFNVPRGTKDSVVFQTDDFERVAALLTGAELRVSDFETTVDAARAGDFVFVDPPYTAKHNANGFLKYNDKIFTWADQTRLQAAIARASRRGALIALTNAHHQSIIDLYRTFVQTPLNRASVLAADAAHRGPTRELLITNYAVPAARE